MAVSEFKYGRQKELKYISHLDIVRLWERALKRTNIPVAYSQGFNPRPRLSFGLPLAVGMTSEAEMLDIFLEQLISPRYLTINLSGQLPIGIDIYEVQEVGLKVPSLQSQACRVEYSITVETNRSQEEVRLAVRDFLKCKHIRWQHIRDNKTRQYDIRELVEDLTILNHRDNDYDLHTTLKISARPEQVVAALGFNEYPKSIHRTKILIDSAIDNN